MTRAYASFACLAAMLAAACESATVPPKTASEVYDFRLPTASRSVLRWPSGSRIRVYIAGGAQPAQAAVLDQAFEIGAGIWNDRAFYAEYRLVRAASAREADVVLRWSDVTPSVETSGCTPVLARAVTTFCIDSTGTRLHVFPLLPVQDDTPSSVRMIVTVLRSEATQPDRVIRLVAHELGHVLGLAQHSVNEQDLMFGGELLRAALSVRDAATVQILYHTRPDVLP